VAFLHTDRAFQLSLPSGALLGLLCDPPIGGSIGGGLRRLCLLAGISVDDLKCRVLGYYHVLVQYITEEYSISIHRPTISIILSTTK